MHGPPQRTPSRWNRPRTPPPYGISAWGRTDPAAWIDHRQASAARRSQPAPEDIPPTPRPYGTMAFGRAYPSAPYHHHHQASAAGSSQSAQEDHSKYHSTQRGTMSIFEDVLEHDIVDKDAIEFLMSNNQPKHYLATAEFNALQELKHYDSPGLKGSAPSSGGDNILLDMQLDKEDLREMRSKFKAVNTELFELLHTPPASSSHQRQHEGDADSATTADEYAERRDFLCQKRIVLYFMVQAGEAWLQYLEDCGGDDPAEAAA
ncbi:hypothetical protein PG989_012216 [Apiospora arundinis]